MNSFIRVPLQHTNAQLLPPLSCLAAVDSNSGQNGFGVEDLLGAVGIEACWLGDLRLEQAQLRLAKPNHLSRHAITDVAFSVGFSATQFSGAFRR